jgi:hypothetical protein
MDFKNRPRTLSVIIPSTPDCVTTATETTFGAGEPYSELVYQPYRSPISPLKHPYRPGTHTEPEMTAISDEISVQLEPHHFRAEDIASPNLLAVANLLSFMKETLVHMTQTFNALEEQSKRLTSLPREAKRFEDVSEVSPHGFVTAYRQAYPGTDNECQIRA